MSRGSSHAHNQRENIGRLLLRAQRDFDAALNARLRERGYPDVRLAHSALFAHIDPEGIRSSELAERAGMTKQGMGQLVADLEKKGYIERVEDPEDRRARVVRLTTKGRRHVRDAKEIIGELEEAYARRLGDGRLESLRAILEDLSPEQ
jgi:MarR family transcriptional regulator, temperature-dependent positive regulator of motility